MGSSIQKPPHDETISLLGSSAGRDSQPSDSDAMRDELVPLPWQRPGSSVYSVDSLPFEPTNPSQLSAAVQHTEELRPLPRPSSARPQSSIYSVETTFSIPILWQPSARPRSSVYSVDSLSWDELTTRVDESVKDSQLETIARLTQENYALQNQLSLYRQAWHDFTRLFRRVQDLTLRVRGIIEEYDGEITAAEAAWVASWGITQI